MPLLLALSDLVSDNLQDMLKLAFSASSLVITVYFWFVRVNREKVSLKVYPDHGFEGTLEPGGVGLWTGRLFLANRSILPTAVVRVKAELWWNGRWLLGNVIPSEGSELPWNLPPSQVFARGLQAAFDVGPDTPRERVYTNQRIRFTFVTIERCRVVSEVETVEAAALAA
jgi:hypothetical protein